MMKKKDLCEISHLRTAELKADFATSGAECTCQVVAEQVEQAEQVELIEVEMATDSGHLVKYETSFLPKKLIVSKDHGCAVEKVVEGQQQIQAANFGAVEPLVEFVEAASDGLMVEVEKVVGVARNVEKHFADCFRHVLKQNNVKRRKQK